MKFKIVDVVFTAPAGRKLEDVWDTIERGLPERAWTEQGVTGGWRERGVTGDSPGEPKLAPGEMVLTSFENGLEHRQGALRLLADLGIKRATETVAWL